MKTRRNHRKTTNSRRRRVIKQQRVQTRIHHRKKTVNSGRRHKFFKRGGQIQIQNKIFNTETTRKFGGYGNNSIFVPSLEQINRDQIDSKNDAAENAARDAARKAEEIGYPDVDQFVSNANTTNVSTVVEFENIKFIVKKTPKQLFYERNVNPNLSTTKRINGITVAFYVASDNNTVDIYVDGTKYGYVMIKINNEEYDSSYSGIYNILVSSAIIKDLSQIHT